MNAFTDRGSVAAVRHFPSPMRSAAPRLAWAAVASIVVHAALFYVPSSTSPSVGHPVMTLIVRTIATTSDAAVSASSAHESIPEKTTLVPPPRATAAADASGHPRAADAMAASHPAATRAARVSPERTQTSSERDGALRAAARDAAAPARAPGPIYHVAGELDPPPRPLHDIEPVYPPEAGFQPGTVVLRLYIDETGAVERVDVLQGTPPGLFENAARTAFEAARFSPGRIAGIAVKCQLAIEVEFTPINRGSDVSGRTY